MTEDGLWRLLRFQIPTTIDECKNGHIHLRSEEVKIDESLAATPWLLHIEDESGAANKLQRTNRFLKNLCATKAFQEKGAKIEWVCLKSINLDNWEPLLNALQQSGARIKKLDLNGCRLTERAALLLGNVLKTTDVYPRAPSNSSSNDNQTTATEMNGSFHIEKLILSSPEKSTAWVDGFLENKTLICLDFCGKPELLKIAMNYIQNAPQLKKAKFFMSPIRFGFVRREEQEEEEEFPKSSGVALNLKSLDINFGSEVPLSLCQSIGSILRRNKTELRTLKFAIWNFHRARRDRLLDAICHEIANNKGPEVLKIDVDTAGLGDLASRLATILVRKNNMKKLEIDCLTMGDDSTAAQRELVDAMSAMPRLRSWKIHVRSTVLSAQTIETWKKWIFFQLESNWNICEASPPFNVGPDIRDLLVFNRRIRKLISNQDKLSSGVWSRALSKITTVGLIYRVVCQIPFLFQQVADTTSQQEAYRMPSFSVPHNPDCPGCCKERGKN